MSSSSIICRPGDTRRQTSPLVCFVSAALIGTAAFSRTPTSHAQFSALSTEDGLPQAFVSSILQDSAGFLWFGTQGGLSRFDGYQFQTFAYDPAEASSLSNNFVKAIAEDPNGDLWVATEGGGLNRRRKGQPGWEHFVHDPAVADSVISNRLRALLVDEQQRLWIGSERGAVDRYDPATGIFHHVLASSAKLEITLRAMVRQESDSTLWIGLDGDGLLRIDDSGRVLDHFSQAADPGSIPSNQICSLLSASTGDLWVGTCGGGLAILRHGSKMFQAVGSDSHPTPLTSSVVWSLHEDTLGTIWAGTDRGLHELRLGSDDILSYQHDPADFNSLKNNRVAAILVDAGGVLWAGTYSGLSYWQTANREFQQYRAQPGVAGALKAPMVTTLLEDKSGGAVWVGTYGAGLNHLDSTNDRFSSFINSPQDPDSLSDNRVMSLGLDRAGTLWIGTLGGGLNRRDPQNGRFQRFRHENDSPHSLSFNGVTAIHATPDGQLWVGTYGGGLNRFRPATQDFEHYRHDPASETSLPSDQILDLADAPDAGLWVAAGDGGLSYFDPRTATFRRVMTTDGATVADYVWRVLEAKNGDLWVGTQAAGIKRWTAENRAADRVAWQTFDESLGLPSQVAYAIVEDLYGDIWISTPRGLVRISSRDGSLRTFDRSNGLQDEFNFAAGIATRDGRMLFGGTEGINVFRPEKLAPPNRVPPVVITNILKNNKSLSPNGFAHTLDTVELTHRDYVVTLEYAVLDFSAPDLNRYRYLLEGFDKEWVDAGPLRRATYTNLRPGRYTFRVQGANNDAVWNERGAAVRFLVRPAPWRTKWAYGGYSLLLVSLLGAYAKVQLRERERAVALDRANKVMTLEIQDRKNKERALEQERQKAQKYLDVAEVILLALDHQGRVLMINEHGCGMLGLPSNEVVGQPWVETFLDTHDDPQARSHFSEPSSDAFEAAIVTVSGEHRIVVWTSTSLPTDDDQPGALFSGTDITQMRGLAQAKEEAESASRAKSQFLANMSHEIRTPMSGVLGMIEILQQGELNDTRRRLLATTRRSAEHLLDILSDILDFSKIEAGRLGLQFGEFELDQLIDDTLDSFSDLAKGKELTLSCRVEPDVPNFLNGDTVRLRQVLSNLLSNALKFTEQGSVRLLVSAEPKSWQDRSKPVFRFAVVDTGPGVPEEIRQSLFEPFRQADGSTTRRHGGTGLGLAIVRELVEMMGGKLGFDTRLGSSSSFWFEVPLEPQPGNRNAAYRRLDPRKQLLLVSNNAESARNIAAKLEQWEIDQVTLADSMLEFQVPSPGDHQDDFDVVVLDEAFPGEHAEVIGPLLSLPFLSRARVVVLSDNAERAAAESHVTAAKPFKVPGLVQALSLGEQTPLSPAGPTEISPRFVGKRILVAEDNDVLQEVIAAFLADSGCEVVTVGTGCAAVDRFSSEPIDLILMDCQMPEMDGYEATAAIRAIEAKSSRGTHNAVGAVPIVAITAHAMDGDTERCVAAGMSEYISKPFTQQQLLKLIATALARTSRLPRSSGPRSGTNARNDNTKPETIGETETLNPAALRQLAQSTGGDSEFIERLISSFVKNTPRLLAELELCSGSELTTHSRRAAHTLKSSSLLLGATRLASCCERVERWPSSGDPELGVVVAAVRREFDEVCIALANAFESVPEIG